MAGAGRVVVVDYGIGNVFSVCHARHAGAEPLLSGDPTRRSETRTDWCCPESGRLKRAMSELGRRGLVEPVIDFVGDAIPRAVRWHADADGAQHGAR